MRILFLIDSLGAGGAQRQVVGLARKIANRGHHVGVAVYHPEHSFFEAKLRTEGVVLHKLRKRSRFSLSLVTELNEVIRREHYERVISFLRSPNLYAVLVKVLNPSIALFVSERSTLQPREKKFPYRLIFQAYRLSDAIITNSCNLRDLLAETFKWMRPKVTVIYNGYDVDTTADPVAHEESDKVKTLVAIGTLVHFKNYENLINALIMYSQKHRETPLIRWIGRVSPSDVENVKLCSERLESAGVSDRWIWEGERSNEDAIAILRESDALVHPSLFEGLSNAICEAFLVGKPVLASAVCEHPVFVSNERGLLFDPTSPEDIAAKLFEFAQLSAEARNRMGLAARQFALKNLSIEHAADRLLELMGSRGRPLSLHRSQSSNAGTLK